MSAPIERHSQEVWRKTAEQLNGDGFSVGGDDSPGKDVNKNGAPLLGDSRDLFRPKHPTFRRSRAYTSGEMVKAGSFT